MTKQAIRYGTVTCRRCGGTGHYSFNVVDGSRCYGCNGKGKVRSAAAKRAAAALTAWADERASVAVTDVKVGDVVWWTAGITGKSGWGKVDSVEVVTSRQSFTDGGVKHSSEQAVVLRSGDRSIAHGLWDNLPVEKVRRPLTTEEYEEYLTYAATLKGVTVITTEEVAA